MANGTDTDLTVDPDLRPDQSGVQYNWPQGQQPAPAAVTTGPQPVFHTPASDQDEANIDRVMAAHPAPVTPAQTTAGYTPAEVRFAIARGMVGRNGLPLFPPGTVKFNSQGVPYNPSEVGPGAPSGPVHWGPDAAQHYEPYWPNEQQPSVQAQPRNQLSPPPAATTVTPPQPNNALSPTGNLVSHLQLQPQPVTGPLQYMPNQPTPTGHTAPGTDPDAGQVVKGTNIPVSVAKQLIRAHEPGAAGYNAAYGGPGGALPQGVTYDSNGFPQYEGGDVGDLYGGKYAGQKSHAAGMFQFEPATWKSYVGQMREAGINITDFSPQSQEQVATWALTHNGVGDWMPYNKKLNAAWLDYQKTGQLPSNLTQPADYQGYSGGGGYYSGDVVPGSGMAVGGKLAIVPPRPAFTGPNAPGSGGPAVNPEANTSGAGGPGGSPSVELTPAEKAFQQMVKNQQGGRGFQMLGLLAAAMRGHQIAPISYDPMANTAHLQTQQMPIGGNYEIPRVSRQISGYVGF